MIILNKCEYNGVIQLRTKIIAPDSKENPPFQAIIWLIIPESIKWEKNIIFVYKLVQ